MLTIPPPQLASLGSLDGHLKAAGESISCSALVAISLHIAEGLAYLHTPKVGILHRDLAARNVLVASDGSCKLADFGLARTVGEGETYVATSAIPVRWSAPEVLLESRVTQASDCYSLAMTLVEVFSAAQLPFADVGTNAGVVDAACAGQRPEHPARCPAEVFEVMEGLWAQEPGDRISAADAVKQLSAVHSESRTTSPSVDETLYANVFLARGSLYSESSRL